MAPITKPHDGEGRDHSADAGGCCECGSTRHSCQDCPVFGGPGGEAAPGDTEALDRIAALLDGREWVVEDLERVAEEVRSTGRTVGEPTEGEPPGETVSQPLFHELERDDDGAPICPNCGSTEWQYAEHVAHWRPLSDFEEAPSLATGEPLL